LTVPPLNISGKPDRPLDSHVENLDI